MTKFVTKIFKPSAGHLRIVLQSAMPIYEGGQRVGDKPGRYADFVNGVFETDNEADIEKLRSLPTFGVDFYEVGTGETGTKAEAQQPSAGSDALSGMTKPQLLTYAKEQGVEVDASLTKPQLIERLTAPKQ